MTCTECGATTFDVWTGVDGRGPMVCWPCARKPLVELEALRAEVTELRRIVEQDECWKARAKKAEREIAELVDAARDAEARLPHTRRDAGAIETAWPRQAIATHAAALDAAIAARLALADAVLAAFAALDKVVRRG